MHNLGDDKELDRLSSEAARGYTPPGQPNWDALSNELDKVMPVEEKKRRIPIFWWLLPALLVGGATAYWLTQKNDSATVMQTTTAASSSLKEITTAAPAQETVGTKQEAVQQPEPAKPSAVESGTVKESQVAVNSNNTTIQDASTAKKSVQKNNKLVAVSGRGTGSIPKLAESNNDLSTADATLKANVVAKKESTNLTSEPAKEDPVLAAAPAKEKTSTNTVTNATQSQTADKTATENKTEPSISSETPAAATATVKKGNTTLEQRGKGLSFGVLAGVDQSTVKFKYGNNVGYNVGVLIGYHFNNKLSIHTGAIFTEKKYKVAGEDFTAPKGSFVSYYKLENVEGYCRMWEVPLAARYTISQGNRNSVFVSTGLSSYFMTKENYDYTYYNNMNVLTMRNSVYNSTDTHLMSILALSAAFESRMGKNTSLLIEPYAKLPLGGVGFGSIRLSSFGLNFSVQYRQPAKK